MKNLFEAPRSAWRRAMERLRAESSARAWARVASAAAWRSSDRDRRFGAEGPRADALASALGAHGEGAARLAMSRERWLGARASCPALVALGAPLSGGWMARLCEMAPAGSFRRARPVAELGLPEPEVKELRAAGLLPERASPLLWLCASMGEMSAEAGAAQWAARFEAAAPFLEPCSEREAAACMYLGRRMAPAMARAGQAEEGRAPAALAAWLERWELSRAARREAERAVGAGDGKDGRVGAGAALSAAPAGSRGRL